MSEPFLRQFRDGRGQSFPRPDATGTCTRGKLRPSGNVCRARDRTVLSRPSFRGKTVNQACWLVLLYSAKEQHTGVSLSRFALVSTPASAQGCTCPCLTPASAQGCTCPCLRGVPQARLKDDTVTQTDAQINGKMIQYYSILGRAASLSVVTLWNGYGPGKEPELLRAGR
jgi:hypothetical protein